MLNNTAIAMRGLRIKSTYEDIIGVAKSDELDNVIFPNRGASFSFLRNSFILSQLDGEGMRVMEQQQQMHIKESFKYYLLKQAAVTKRVHIYDKIHPSKNTN